MCRTELQEGADSAILELYAVGAFPQICPRSDQHHSGLLLEIRQDHQHSDILPEVPFAQLDRQGLSGRYAQPICDDLSES